MPVTTGALTTFSKTGISLTAGLHIVKIVIDAAPAKRAPEFLDWFKLASSPGTIKGSVYNDANVNGMRDVNETGLAKWDVYLDGNDNGKLDAGEPVAVTNTDGSYMFGNIEPGIYHVRVLPKTGYAVTAPATGDFNVSVGFGQTLIENFGETSRAIISGTVFSDKNKNGKLNPGESGLFGWTVFIDANNTGVLDASETSTLTDSKGHYSFVLAPGTYIVKDIVKPGNSPTFPSSGRIAITIKPGQVLTAENFGNL